MAPTLYVKNVEGLSDEQKRLYESKNSAMIQDAVTEGMLKVPVQKALRNYADVSPFAVYAGNRPNDSFSLNSHKITSPSSSTISITLRFSASAELTARRPSASPASSGKSALCLLLLRGSKSASRFFRQKITQLVIRVHRPEPWAPHGAQHLILATIGLEEAHRIKDAIRNIHIMATLRKRLNGFKALRDFIVGGEDTICLSLPFSTNPEHVLPHEQVVPLPEVLDPRGITSAFIQRKGHIVTNRNLLDVWLAEPTRESVLLSTSL